MTAELWVHVDLGVQLYCAHHVGRLSGVGEQSNLARYKKN